MHGASPGLAALAALLAATFAAYLRPDLMPLWNNLRLCG